MTPTRPQKPTQRTTARPGRPPAVDPLAAIRSVLHDATPQGEAAAGLAPEPNTKRSKRFAALSDGASARQASREASHLMTEPKQEVHAAEPEALAAETRAKSGGLKGIGFIVRFTGLVCLFLLMYFQPFLIIGMIVFTVILLIASFLILGSSGSWQRISAFSRKYAERRPEKAARIHAFLDGFAMKWDSVLDRFPEGSVDAFYLPDFGNGLASDAAHKAALDTRFSRMGQPAGQDTQFG